MAGTMSEKEKPRKTPAPQAAPRPVDDRTRAKAILAALIDLTPDGEELPTRTAVYKVFYFAHLIHMHEHGRILSDWPIVKMPNGPGLDRGADLLQELEVEGGVKQESESRWIHTAIVCKPTDRRVLRRYAALLNENEIKSLRDANKAVHGKTASELSDLTHKYSASWKSAAMGRELAIYIDLIVDDDEATRRKENLADVTYHLMRRLK